MKITIIGAGNVGSSTAYMIAQKNIVKKIILLDLNKNIAQGKALDISQTSYIYKFDTKIYGTNKYEKTNNSEIIIITSGLPRKPGMSREDLVNTNAKIVKLVTKKAMQYSPHAKLIIVSNPLDIMTHTAYITAKIKTNKIMGMAGILDSIRYFKLIADKLKCSNEDISGLLLGNHGDSMMPLIRYTNVSGIPISYLLNKKEIIQIINKTKKGGEEIVKLLGTSAYLAPAASVTKMVESIIHDKKKIISCCVLLNGEYGFKNIFIGVPAVLGKKGVEKIIEVDLNKEEIMSLNNSVENIKKTIKSLKI